MQLGRIHDELGGGDPDALWKALIDVDFLVYALWKMRLAGNLAQRTTEPSWTALQELDRSFQT